LTDEVARRIGPDRRTFVKRLVIGTVFAAPLVQSFSMSGIEAVFGKGAGATTAMANSNGTPPPHPTNYSSLSPCFTVPFAGTNLHVNDGGVTVTLMLPSSATLPSGTTICFYKGDLTALAALFPTGQTLLSAYAVLWNGPNNSNPTASPSVKLVVSDPAVADGSLMYDVSTGTPVSVGTTTAGAWSQTFANDPLFVVTGPVPTPPPASTPPASSGSTTPVAVVAEPRTTG
jgi:hypothetical protein